MNWYKLSLLKADDIQKWIKQLIQTEFEDKPDSGWCGEIAGEIYKYLGGKSAGAKIIGLVVIDTEYKNEYIKKYGNKTYIENMSPEDYEYLQDEIKGTIFHSFVEYQGHYIDGTGYISLNSILKRHAGVNNLGDGPYGWAILVREDGIKL